MKPPDSQTVDDLLERLEERVPTTLAKASGLAAFREVARSASGTGQDGHATDSGRGGEPDSLRGRLLDSLRLRVQIELGRTRMPLADAMELGPGAVVDLGKETGSQVRILVAGVPIARGEVLVVDERFCVRVTEVFGPRASQRESPMDGEATVTEGES